MIIDTTVEINITNRNKGYYNSKGYPCTRGETINIKLEDIYIGSSTKVNVECQGCKIPRPMAYNTYLVNINSTEIHIYYCNKCNHIKTKQLNEIKQSNGELTRDMPYFWTFPENIEKELYEYIAIHGNLEVMVKKDQHLYNAICDYQGGTYNYITELKLNFDELFPRRKPDEYYTKEFVVDSIQKFIKENNRFPSQVEMVGILKINSSIFNRFFKDFSECKKYINYYNPSDMVDNRGDVNRSFYELCVANFLIEHGLGDKYLREEYPFKQFDDNLTYRSDFTLYAEDKNKPIHIEVWGHNEENNKFNNDYNLVRQTKESLYELYEEHMTLISIEPNVFKGKYDSIAQKLYSVLKDVLKLNYKCIDYKNIISFKAYSEDDLFAILKTYSAEPTRLPNRHEITSKDGGYGLLNIIQRRYGGLGYFADKYNIEISHRNKYWSKEKVFETYDYMILNYGKFLSTTRDVKDSRLKGFESYTKANYRDNDIRLEYIENLINQNKILTEYLYNYLNDVLNNKLYKNHKVTPDQQQLAKEILSKYNNNQISQSNYVTIGGLN